MEKTFLQVQAVSKPLPKGGAVPQESAFYGVPDCRFPIIDTHPIDSRWS